MEIRVALVGIGGYGVGYAQELLMAPTDRELRLVAGIDPYPDRSRILPELNFTGIPIFANLQDFIASDYADLVIISSPIHLHASQTCLVLAHGAHVLCEKPLCAVIQDGNRMAEAEKQTGKIVAIGYQWSFSPAIQALKSDILAGIFGRPRRLKTRIFWPRLASYYKRNHWAGRIKSDDGDWVLDSPANNAMAHYLHNALYVIGSRINTSARPFSVQAELYRSNPIENYDAAALRILTEGDVEVLFYGAHSVPYEVHPTFYFEFETATIEYTAYSGNDITAHFTNGRVRKYGDPNAPDTRWEKLWQTIHSIRTGQPLACGIEAAKSHTRCINGAQESHSITTISNALIRQETRGETDTLTWAIGMQEAFDESYNRNCLPSELGSFPWTRAGKVIDITHYDNYPMA